MCVPFHINEKHDITSKHTFFFLNKLAVSVSVIVVVVLKKIPNKLYFYLYVNFIFIFFNLISVYVICKYMLSVNNQKKKNNNKQQYCMY